MSSSPVVPTSAQPGARLRVLIVEDSEFDARLLGTLLRTGGWEVASRRVSTASDLERVLVEEEWDLILCDHTMPGFSAPEALRVVQRVARDIPFIIISGGIEEGVAIDAMKAGAHDFLMKGALGRLVPAVQRELKEAGIRRARRTAEEALRESELRYRSVWDNSTDAVLLLDASGVIRFANPANLPVFGWDPTDLVGLRLDVLQPVELPPGHWWQSFRISGMAKSNETVARRRDGSPVDIDLALTEMRRGSDLWVVIFSRDVTERRRAAEEIRRSREEFAAAREIQQRLFPKEAPRLAGYDIAGASHPAEATGGDYFDFFPIDPECLGMVIADVSGHGLGPSLLMAEARAYLRLVARGTGVPGDVLTRTQELLRDDLGRERFITLMFLRLLSAQRRLQFANAGHTAGLVIGRDGTVRTVLGRTGRPLGRQGDVPYPSGGEVMLQPGDILLLLTDGIEEAMRSDDEIFGMERAVAVVRSHRDRPASEIVEAVCTAARTFSSPEPQTDDLTVVVLKAL